MPPLGQGLFHGHQRARHIGGMVRPDDLQGLGKDPPGAVVQNDQHGRVVPGSRPGFNGDGCNPR